MSDAAEITTLLSEPDTTEMVLNQIAGILALELENQAALAEEEENASASDYNVHVFVENDEPWMIQTEDNKNNVLPAVVVRFDHYALNGEDGTYKSQLTGSFFIDCYAAGNFDGEGFAGRVAKLKSMKLARLVRNILNAACYRYLKLRGLVMSKSIVRQDSGEVDGGASVKIGAQRIQLDVVYYETSPQSGGVNFELIDCVCNNATGEVLFEAESDTAE